MIYFIYCDGGARGNPGPAGVGFIITNLQGKVLIRAAKFIGKATNNVAEYQAVIEALKWLDKKEIKTNVKGRPVIKFFLDSMLVVNQLNGFFKIKNSYLRDLVIEIRQLEISTKGQISYHYIPREKNQKADDLVNQIIDKKI